MGELSREKSRMARAAIPVILKYNLLRQEGLRAAVVSSLPKAAKGLVAGSIGRSGWEVVVSLFEAHLTERTTVVSDLPSSTGLVKATVRRCLGELETMGVIGIRRDERDRRRRIVFLTEPYREIVDRFAKDWAEEHKDLVEHHDRRQREKAEMRAQAILDSALDAIVTVDKEGEIVGFNRSAERIFGYGAAHAIGRSIADLIIPPAHRERHVKTFRRGLAEGNRAASGRRYDTTAMAADGREFPVELTVITAFEDENECCIAFIRDISERKQAEKALVESENRFRRLFENAPLGYQSLNEDGRFIEVNRAWLEMFGYYREEVIGRWFGDFLVDKNLFDKNFSRFKEAGKIHVPGYEMLCKDGSIKLVAFDGRVGYDEQGNFVQTHCILTDITERKRSEEALRESEAAYRNLMEDASDGIFIADADGVYIDANRAACAMLGYSKEEIVGKHIKDLIAPDDIQAKPLRLGRLKREDDVVIERKLLRKDGSTVIVETHAKQLPDGRLQGIARDITERKRAEEQLEVAVESISGGFALFDADDRFVLCNNAYRQTHGVIARLLKPGVSFERIVRELAGKRFYGNTRNETEAVIGARLEAHRTGGVVEYQLEDGRWFQSKEYRTEQGGTAVIRTDVTEHKRAEVELQKARNEAEAANRAKSEFLATVSHDLRTPLTAIMGFSEVMLRHTFGPLGDPHYEEYARDIHQGGTLLLGFIDDILDISRIEAGKEKLEDKAVDIGSLVQSIVNLIGAEADTARLGMKVELPSGLPWLRCDEGSMIRIVNNILSNALKFTPEGGNITVSVKVLKKGSIVITVADTGIGMTGEDIAKALEPYEQADSSHPRKHEGTGLGLYICRRHMELHGGILTIKSKVGKGTTVSGRFPPERTIHPS